MALSQQQKWVLFAALITAVVAASAGIVFGILVHLREETVTGKSTSYYGTIRMNRVEGKSLQWTSSLSNGSSTHSIGARSFLQSHLFESMSRLSRPLSSVNIIRFSEDKFAQLVGAKNRGIHVDFKLEIQDDIHGPEVENLLKDELLSILSNDERFELDPESLEIDTKPLMKARSFEAFETYLSEGDTFNLLNTQLPGVKQPLEMSQPKFCAKISTINHGSVSPVSCLMSNHSSLGDSCTFMCDTNFTIVGFKTLTCLSTGRWSGPQPLCKAKCPALPTYMGVKISPSICFQSASYSDTRCFYHCSMGYVLDGISARVCLDNGMWSGVAPMCKKTCAALSVPENGAVWPASCTSDTLQPAGSLCTYSCIEGYTLAGSPNLLCEMDGSWNFPAPTCRRGCPPLVPPEHGSIFPPLCSRTLMKGDHAAVVMEGVVCVHTCEPGFKLEGSRQRMCGTGGSWTGKVTTCSELCPVLPLPPLMTASPHICTDPHGDRVEGLKCHVMCPNNFCSAGEMDVTCGSRGVWSSIPTDCMSTCPILKPVMNGMLYPDDCRADLPAVVEGTKCTLKCGDGFMLHGSMSVQCLTIGKWSEELGQCLKQCPPLLPPSHGFIEPSNCTVASVYQGGVCNYVCDTDYGLIGEESRTCLTDGTWSSEEPTCLVETQFMIRQTRDERDVCLDVNTITNHAEKRPISQCYLNNRLQRWTVHPEGVIRNVGTRKCLSVEHRHPGSYIAMKECTSSDPNQIWLWEDTNGVSVTLLGTSLVMGYGYASIAKVILVDSSIESSLPWYAITSNGSFSLYDIFTTVGCPRLHPPYLMSISPEKCMTNQTLESGTTCTFTCDIGHKLKGNNRRTCVKGRWDGEYPSCSVACPSIPPPSGGSVTIYCQFMAQDEGVSCDFDCNQGYVLEGDVTTVCLSSGNWSNATPNCTFRCPSLPHVSNGVVLPQSCIRHSSSIGTECKLSCENPYIIKGVENKRCLSDGSWSDGTFACERGCYKVLTPSGGGNITCPNAVVSEGDTCAYGCGPEPHRGLTATDSNTGVTTVLAAPGPSGVVYRTCHSDGLFDSVLPVCMSVCQPLTAPVNGTITPASCTSQYSAEGSVCSILCNLGHGNEGAKSVKCLNTGVWDSNTYQCEEETQFLITNPNAMTPMCLYANTSLQSENYGWYVLKQEFRKCEDTSTLWAWGDNKHLKHVSSRLCLSILDRTAKRMTPLILQECAPSDPNQKWVCDPSNPGRVHPLHSSLYINIGDTDSNRAVAYRYSDPGSILFSHLWKARNALNKLSLLSICALHTNKCPAFVTPPHSSAVPDICDGKTLINVNTVCTVTCDPGYMFTAHRSDSLTYTCESDKQWTYHATAVCSKPCPAPSPSPNLVFDPPACGDGFATFKDTCIFQCDPGYDKIGSSFAICGADGLWSTSPPFCTRICPHLPPTSAHPSANQTIYATPENCDYDNDKYGSVVTVGTQCKHVCPPPYLPHTSLIRTCMADKTFDRSVPECYIPVSVGLAYNPLLCPEPPPHPQALGFLIEVASCTLPDNTVRQCAWYGCTAEYMIPTDNAIHCLANIYTWPDPPTCKRRCRAISPQCAEMSEGDVCAIECPVSQLLSHGNGRLVCNADGTWSDNMPYCVQKPQFWITNILRSNMSKFCLFHSSRISVDPYLRLKDCSLASKFDPDYLWSWDGMWSLRHKSSSYCLSVQSIAHGARLILSECNPPQQLQQWKGSGDPHHPYRIQLKSNEKYIWKSGFGTTGPILIHTDSLLYHHPTLGVAHSLSWVSFNESETYKALHAMHYTGNACPPLASVVSPGGRLLPHSCTDDWSPINQVCTFECGEGYAKDYFTPTKTTCLKTGVWSAINFDCDRACPDLSPPFRGQISGCGDGVKTVGTSCDVSCEYGHELVGSTTRVCQWDGRWSGTDAECDVPCPTSPPVANSELLPPECAIHPGTLLAGAVCNYECLEGYQVEENPGVTKLSRMCFQNGTWSSPAPVCVRVCPPQTDPPNGRIFPVVCTTGESSAGFQCKVNCNDGFAVYGNNTRVCSQSGTWHNSVTDDFGPVCRTECVSIPATPNSHIECGDPPLPPSNQYLDGVTCTTVCDPGYGISPTSIARRTCTQHAWSGTSAKCEKETQFRIFLLRLFRNGKQVRVCLSVDPDTDLVQKVFSQQCTGNSQLQRWTWFNETRLKNAATGKCLGVSTIEAGLKVTTGPCTGGDLYNEWSCSSPRGDSLSWFLTLSGTDLYADYGFAATSFLWTMNIKIFNPTLDDVHWYATPTDDASSDSSPITVCAMRMTHGICAPLILSNHGQVHPLQCNGNSVTVGMRCMFSCDVGYQLTSEENTVVCQANGLWSGSVPTCAVVCEALDDVPHGRIHPDSCIGEHENPGHGSAVGGVLSGVQCTVECDNGFMMVGGPGILTCLGDGSWNSPQPACKRMCPLLSTVEYAVPSDASCHTEQKYHGQVCSFRCFSGYGVPRAEKSCKKSSNTSVLLGFTDSSEYCSDERKREEGYEEEKEKEEGYEVEVHLSCMLDGKWSAQLPMCQPLCPALVLQEHGYIEPLSCVEQPQMVGKMCNYNCNDGYTAHDKTSNFTCIEGKWIPSHVVTSAAFDIDIFDNYIHESPLCEIYCPPLVVPSLNQSLVTPASCLTLNNAIATVCEIECHSDYVLKGQTSVVCMEDGTWDTLLGTCIQKCPSVTAPPNGEVRPLACSTASMGDGAVCSFACTDKYSLDGATTILCNGSGNWSAIPPTCKRRCLPIPRFYNGYASPISSCFTEHITSGEICHFTCADNFLLIGQDQITCLESGEWEGSPPTCNRICHRPQVPHGSISCTHSNIQLNITSALTWGSICRLQCIRNYAPSHNAGFICGNDGEWRPTIPHCIETGVPMYILQTLGEFSLCLVEHEAERSVVKLSQSECLVHTSYASNTSWHWLGSYNIQNAHSGYCITVRSSSEGEKLRTAPCNTDDNLQHWDCSVDNAFQVVLRGTDLSPSTFYKNVDAVVLQKWSDAHSYFSTFDLVTLSASSICSRRPGGICPPLHNAVDGKVEPEECKSNDVVAGQQCSYECHDDDAYLSGSAYTICMGNGLWSSPPPACVKSCHPLSEVPFLPKGTYYLDDDCVFDSPSVGKSCDALCMSGYDLVGNATRECLTTGQWSPVKYNCQRTCPSIFGLLHGTVDPMPCRSGICSFKCRPGYVLVGSETYNILCMDDGTWNNILPKCIRDPQFQIIFVESNSGEEMCLTLPASTSDPLIKSSCSRAEAYDGSQLFKWNGDLLINPESGLCLRGNVERWGNVSVEGCWEEDSLQKWDCGARPGVYDNALRLKDTSLFLDYGSTVDVSRSNEKEALLLLEVVMETEYVMTSRWLARHYYGQGTVCSMKNERQCAPFQQVLHGTVFPHVCLSHDNIVKGLICQVKCDQGYTQLHTDRSVCLNDGTWSTPIPACTGIYQCPALPVLDSTIMVEPSLCKATSVTDGVVCTFMCDDHYKLHGPQTIQCETPGVWSEPPPSCNAQCEGIPYIDGGSVSPFTCYGPNNDPGTTCSVSCDPKFRLIGSNRRKCKDNGMWSGEDAMCVVFCPPLDLPLSGYVYPDRCRTSENFEENSCNFQCVEDHVMIGNSEVTCVDGSWDRDVPQCVPMSLCPRINENKPGVKEVLFQYLVKGTAVGNGTQITVVCSTGYLLDNGPEVRTCLNTGQWEYGTPHCKPTCPPVLPPVHSSVLPAHCGWKRQAVDNGCMVSCDVGWSIQGNHELQCMENGVWSDDTPSCVGGEYTDFQTKPFIVRQIDAKSKMAVCLKANMDSNLIEADHECSSPYHQWHWRDLSVGLIESIGGLGQCWSPARHGTRIRLALAPCDPINPSQHFKCSDLSLRQCALHVGVEGLWLGRDSDAQHKDNHIYLLSNPGSFQMDWEALEPTAVSLAGNMSYGNTLCRKICGGEINLNEGIIQSPGYPVRYQQNTICRWIIKAPNKMIRFWVTDLDLSPGRDLTDKSCDRDRLTIMEGDEFTEDSAHVLATVCGKLHAGQGPITTVHGKLLLEFRSGNYEVTKRGFQARWVAEALDQPQTECGATSPSSGGNFARLVGGVKEAVENVPWHAAVFSDDVGTRDDNETPLCGATIIRHSYALTAAHCLDHLTSQQQVDKTILGYATSQLWRLTRLSHLLRDSDITVASMDDDTGASVIRLSRIYSHPTYSENLDSDIVLIKVAEPITWSSRVFPVCLPSPESLLDHVGHGRLHIPKQYCKLAGWGSSSELGDYASDLAIIEIPVMSDKHCERSSASLFGRRVNIRATLCAGHFDGTRQSPCKGDDGGGLTCFWNDNHYLVGVAGEQFGECSLLNVPRYFTRVSTFIKWVEDTIRKSKFGYDSNFAKGAREW